VNDAATDPADGLSGRFADFAQAFTTGAPLYSCFADRTAREPEILELMSRAAPMQRIPVLLFASVHYLLLEKSDHPLALHYPNLHPEVKIEPSHPSDVVRDPGDDFVKFVLGHRSEIASLLASRSTQTNEIARCNWFVFPFHLIEEEYGPISRIDVGSSAGLTLLFPHLTFDLQPGGVVGDGQSLIIQCVTRGSPPIPTQVPRVPWSVGIDASPISIQSDEDVRWLEACVWPDHVDRFDRLIAAVHLARQHQISVRKGEAVADIANLIAEARPHGHPVITTSWVMNYLSPDQRRSFVAELDRIGATIDFSWVIAESPRETPELPVHAEPDEDITVISLVTWHQGQRNSQRLATTHPHGSWVNWGV
jgi:hypothetical protein